MNKGLYFWKTSRIPGKKQGIILAVLLATILGSVSGWYYLVYIPHKKHDEEIQKKKADVANKIKKIDDFYEGQLKGGGVEQFTLLLNEIYQSRMILGLTSYDEKLISCKPDSCTFGYEILKSHVFNVQKKVFWGKEYSASFSNKGINFSGIPSNLKDNATLTNYRKKRDVAAVDCGRLLNYIYAFNSISDKSDQIIIAKPPASSVLDVESEVKSQKKSYGLLFSTWSMNAKNDPIHVMSIFERQAFKESFIIKGMELKSKALKITGSFVCKSGK